MTDLERYARKAVRIHKADPHRPLECQECGMYWPCESYTMASAYLGSKHEPEPQPRIVGEGPKSTYTVRRVITVYTDVEVRATTEWEGKELALDGVGYHPLIGPILAGEYEKHIEVEEEEYLL